MSRARDLADLGNNAGGLETLTVSDITDITATADEINLVDGSVSGPLSHRNLIINGAMQVAQRGTGSFDTTGDIYTLDRWKVVRSQNSKFTVQQNAGSVTPPSGFSKYLGVTSSSAYSIGTSDYFMIDYRCEGQDTVQLDWGTSGAKDVTLSFKVYSSLTGNFSGVIYNASSGATRRYPFLYTISSANTWTDISVTIPGDTVDSWGSDNNLGLIVRFGLGVGSTYTATAGSWTTGTVFGATGGTSVVGTSGATWYITGVQLELGSVATPFEMRSYGEELARCQRYFYAVDNSDPYHMVANGHAASSTLFIGSIATPVMFRDVPSLSATGSYEFAGALGGDVNGTIIITDPTTSNNLQVRANVTGSFTEGNGGFLRNKNDTSATFHLDAEL